MLTFFQQIFTHEWNVIVNFPAFFPFFPFPVFTSFHSMSVLSLLEMGTKNDISLSIWLSREKKGSLRIF